MGSLKVNLKRHFFKHKEFQAFHFCPPPHYVKQTLLSHLAASSKKAFCGSRVDSIQNIKQWPMPVSELVCCEDRKILWSYQHSKVQSEIALQKVYCPNNWKIVSLGKRDFYGFQGELWFSSSGYVFLLMFLLVIFPQESYCIVHCIIYGESKWN